MVAVKGWGEVKWKAELMKLSEGENTNKGGSKVLVGEAEVVGRKEYGRQGSRYLLCTH